MVRLQDGCQPLLTMVVALAAFELRQRVEVDAQPQLQVTSHFWAPAEVVLSALETKASIDG